MDNQGEITYATVQQIIGKTGKYRVRGSRSLCVLTGVRLERRYYTSESRVREQPHEKLGEKRERTS